MKRQCYGQRFTQGAVMAGALCAAVSICHAQEVSAGLAPPPSDPRAIEGVWQPTMGPPPKMPGGRPPPTNTAAAAIKGSTLVCTPVQRLAGAGGGMSNLWVVGPREIVMISEEDQDVRKIYLTTKHPAKLVPQPNGNSIGHWDGDTLIVDSIGFTAPHADEHVVERIRKSGNRLLDSAVISRNGATETREMDSVWRPDYQVWENVCEEGFANFKIINGQLDNTGSNQ